MPAAELSQIGINCHSLVSNSVPPELLYHPPHPQDPSELPGDANTFRGEEGEEDVQVTAVKIWRRQRSCLKCVFAF